METLEMPALGRPFDIGMLYNLRRDKMISGLSLWNQSTLTRNMTTTKGDKGVDSVEISKSDDMKTKSLSLQIGSHLKLSLLGEMLQVQGAAKYINDRKSSTKQARVTLVYKLLTDYKHMSREQKTDLEHASTIEKSEATHVVIGIQYGIDAIFVFNQSCTSVEKAHEVQGSMGVALEASIPTSPGAAVSGQMSSNNKQKNSNITCTYHGDVPLTHLPSTYKEALEACNKLCQKSTAEKSTPKIIHLCPLSKLHYIYLHQQRVFEVGDVLTSKIENIMEYLYHIEMECTDLLEREECAIFRCVHEQITQFKKLLQQFIRNFKSNLSPLTLEVRNNGQVGKLEEFIKSVETSPYKEDSLKEYICYKHHELSILKRHTENINKFKRQITPKFSNSELSSAIHNTQFQQLICFAFNVTAKETPYMRAMATHLSTGNTSSVSSKEWINDIEIESCLITTMKRFLAFVEDNKDNTKFTFIVSEEKYYETDAFIGPTIIRYIDGKSEKFDPPSAPQPPKCIGDDHNFISLRLPAFSHSDGPAYRYIIQYRRSSSGPIAKWIEKETVEEITTISNLSSNTEYSIRVHVLCRDWVSPESSVITAKTTPFNYKEYFGNRKTT